MASHEKAEGWLMFNCQIHVSLDTRSALMVHTKQPQAEHVSCIYRQTRLDICVILDPEEEDALAANFIAA